MNNNATKTQETNIKNPTKAHKLIIDNQRKASVTSVVKAVSANQQMVVLQLSNSKLHITGAELFLSKLDIVSGVAEVEGKIASVKYAGSGEQKGFFTRLFK